MVKRHLNEHVDELGRRIGYMTPEEFVRQGKENFGFPWQTRFRVGFGYSPASITRYVSGIYPIPQHVAMSMTLVTLLKQNNIPLPEEFSPPLFQGEENDDEDPPADPKAAKSGR